MAYSDFTLSKLQRNFGIEYHRDNLFNIPLKKTEPSERLKMDIDEGLLMPVFSEKAKSELLITPIFREIRRTNHNKFTFFSGFSFDVDAKRELNGICDFLLTRKPDAIEINDPVFCLVEAKNRTIEEGFGQCAAEMYATYLFNKEFGIESPIVYGCVTNAFEWVFLKLENETIIIDNHRYSINDLSELLGALQNIVNVFFVD
jgi:Holliday junction resolvase